MTLKLHLYEINFKNDKLHGNTYIIYYMNPIDKKGRWINTSTNKCYLSWEKMALEEYKKRGLVCEKLKMYDNIIWNEKKLNLIN